jgi:hypothetical protein
VPSIWRGKTVTNRVHTYIKHDSKM